MHPILRTLIVITAALAALHLPSVHAATLYWDTNDSTAGTGGTGTWSDASGNWSTDTAGTLPTVWNSTARDVADLRGTAGTVTVASGVAAESLLFNDGGFTVSGTDLVLGRASGTTNYTFLNYASGTGANTIDANIVLEDSDSGSTTTYTVNNSSGSELTLNGNLTVAYATPATGNNILEFTTGTNDSVITINGDVARGTDSAGLAFYFGQGGSSESNAAAINGTFYVNGDNSDVNLQTRLYGGTVIIGHDNALGSNSIRFGTSASSGVMTLLTDGALTVTNALILSGSGTSSLYIGGGSAHESTFTGDFNLASANADPIFTAAAGGRVNFSGNLQSSGNVRSFIKEGAGIVALTRAEGNNYTAYTHVNEGTLLLMNTSGSATGDGSFVTVGEAGVRIASGAALGGTGISTVQVEALAADSVISAGDMTLAGVSSIGTLNLDGGLVADNGVSFHIDIDGASIDSINFGSGDLALAGDVTFDFTSLGSVLTGVDYTLLTGTGDWSGSVSASFVFNGPDGYTVDSFDFDTDNRLLTVQFTGAVIPEPSTAALLAGLGTLLMAARKRRHSHVNVA